MCIPIFYKYYGKVRKRLYIKHILNFLVSMRIPLGQSSQSLAFRPSLDPGFPGLARPGWPCGPGFPIFLMPWPAWPKLGLWLGSPRLSGQALTPVFLVWPGSYIGRAGRMTADFLSLGQRGLWPSSPRLFG